MEASNSSAISTIIPLLDELCGALHTKSDVPHELIRPTLQELRETSSCLVGIKKYEIIVCCIDTIILLEPMINAEKRLHVLNSIVGLVNYIVSKAFPDALISDVSPTALAAEPTIIRVYFSVAATFPLKILVVVTRDTIALPSQLTDGTAIHQINIYQSTQAVPAPPGSGYSGTKVNDSYVFATLKSVQDLMKARKNVFAVTASFVRGSWTILVGVVGKGLVPCGDTLLPKRIGAYPIVVCEFRMIPLHRQRWLPDAPQPQIGGAIAPAAHLCRMGTIGPAFDLGDGRNRFLASGHVFKDCLIGGRVVLPGMMARALDAIDTGGGGRDSLPTMKNILRKMSATEGVQQVQETYPAHIQSAEQNAPLEFATLVAIDPMRDIAAVRVDVDRNFSTAAWNWTDAGPPQGVAAELNGQAWQKDEFEEALDKNASGIVVYGYGAATGENMGTAFHLAFDFVSDTNVIAMRDCDCAFGDSGSAVWTVNPDGTAKVLGMVNRRAEWLISGDNISVTATIFPSWELQAFVAASAHGDG